MSIGCRSYYKCGIRHLGVDKQKGWHWVIWREWTWKFFFLLQSFAPFFFFPSCCILPNFFPFFCVLFYLERVELWWWIVVAAGFFSSSCSPPSLPLLCPHRDKQRGIFKTLCSRPKKLPPCLPIGRPTAVAFAAANSVPATPTATSRSNKLLPGSPKCN